MTTHDERTIAIYADIITELHEMLAKHGVGKEERDKFVKPFIRKLGNAICDDLAVVFPDNDNDWIIRGTLN